MKDCHRGVIFDGLESLFTQNVHNSAQCILKAINNRKYIFGVGLKLDYAIIKEKEKEMEAEKGINVDIVDLIWYSWCLWCRFCVVLSNLEDLYLRLSDLLVLIL